MSKKTFLSLLFISGILLIVLTAPAKAVGPTVKWVDQSGGSDSNDGNTETTAYASLQKAVDESESGTDNSNRSIIYVKDGTYNAGNTSSTCEGGYPNALWIKDLDYLTIQAASGHEPVVKPAAASNIVSVVVENSDHLIVDNLDSDQTVAQFDNWHVCNSNDLTVKNSHFEGGEDGIDFNTDLTTALIENNTFLDINTGSGDEVLDFTDGNYSDVTIQDNIFINNYRQITINPTSTTSGFTIRRNLMNGTTSEEAVRLIGASDILLENNVILNNRQQGVYIDDGCSNITIQHNTFFHNDQEGAGNGEIRTKILTADILIKNNILNPGGTNPAIETTAASLPGEDYNLVYNDSSGFTFGANTIFGDPLFVSTTPGSEDLHLTSTSPAIGAGTDLGVTDDKDKNPRPTPPATNPDIGAYEFIVTNNPPVCSAATPSVDKIWPPNHQFVSVNILGVTDDDNDPLTITINSIYQDEPIEEKGDGSFVPDGQGVGSSTAEVRAERLGNGNGRFYHISFIAEDGQGGQCSAVVSVVVPKSMGKKDVPVDGGALFDSTAP